MARMEYERVVELTAVEYAERMIAGWRRFGHTLFRPRCSSCQACRSLRVEVVKFRPKRSQRRVRKMNEGAVALEIGEPRISWSRLDLYRRFHAERAERRGWNDREEDPISYHDSFVSNPFPTLMRHPAGLTTLRSICFTSTAFTPTKPSSTTSRTGFSMPVHRAREGSRPAAASRLICRPARQTSRPARCM